METKIKIKLHDTTNLTKGVNVFEVFISDNSRGISALKGLENLLMELYFVL